MSPHPVPAAGDTAGEAAVRAPVARYRSSAVALEEHVGLYHEQRGELVLLNETAAAVWECCDGRTDVATIVAELADRYSAPAQIIGEEVRSTLGKLAELGLVDDGPASPRGSASG